MAVDEKSVGAGAASWIKLKIGGREPLRAFGSVRLPKHSFLGPVSTGTGFDLDWTRG